MLRNDLAGLGSEGVEPGDGATQMLSKVGLEISDRRSDVDGKQSRLAPILADAGCDGLLLLKPANFRWFTSGAEPRGLIGADEAPCLYVNATQRWLICNNTDSQRFFDEELDGLGFQLKEWPCHGNREQFLAELCLGRRVASDIPFRDCRFLGAFLEQERRRLSPYEVAEYQNLGRNLVHAIEAAARNLSQGDSENEIAGHLAHRLLRRGIEPTVLHIAADEHGRAYRRLGHTAKRVKQFCVLQATGSRAGLFATASRIVCFGPLNETLRKEFDLAIRLSAIWLATARANERPATALEMGRNLLWNTPYEHEWRLAAAGCWSGREASDGILTPTTNDRFLPGHVVVWQARVGAMAVCDTHHLIETGWQCLTPAMEWPLRRIIIQGIAYDRPDLLIRN